MDAKNVLTSATHNRSRGPRWLSMETTTCTGQPRRQHAHTHKRTSHAMPLRAPRVEERRSSPGQRTRAPVRCVGGRRSGCPGAACPLARPHGPPAARASCTARTTSRPTPACSCHTCMPVKSHACTQGCASRGGGGESYCWSWSMACCRWSICCSIAAAE
jgi:hypothetical protein